MKRVLNISNPLWADETITIVEVDHFLHRVDAVEWSVVLSNGNGSIELPALKLGSQNFYYILEKRYIFALWDNDDSAMTLDECYSRNIYPVMNGSSDDETMDILNFNCTLNRYLKGEPIMSKEEEKILCEYFNFANSQELGDKRLCVLDEGLANEL
ncbi:hypothetical protein MNB_SV-13-131 [hydrothermal vent metagenome]|uniref:Uncharacterized protein n=1 Tax=hydrothermal vent metagenome TaxID=652676 RepID=A0A1W1CZ05_9ZZZZ